MFPSTITNEQLNELPMRNFEGEIIVIDNEASMERAAGVLQGETLLGFDTETRPAFQKGTRYKMALMQISTADTALLFRLHSCTLSKEVVKILENPGVLKIGAALHDDLSGLQKVCRFRPAGFVDLQSRIEHWGIQEKSVKKMAAIALGIKISKAQRLSNWEAVNLTPSQRDYAAMDAWVCREIYAKLQKIVP